jgi:hypothetical protein
MIQAKNGNCILTAEEFNGAIAYHERREKFYQLGILAGIVFAFLFGISL